ncbi:ankyrin repeat protein, partial [Cyathus striatus]
TALHYACAMGNLEVAKLLLTQDGINPNIKENQNGLTPLHLAVKNHINIVRLLLLHPDINPNIFNSKGETALHLAVKNSCEDMLTLLL